MRNLALGFLAHLFLFSGCVGDSVCDNDLARQVVSPDGTLKAVVFFRGCGATTDESAQVSILPATAELPNEGGNVMVAAESNLYVKWLDNSRLQVTVPPGVKSFFKATTCGSIAITYKLANANEAP